LLVLRLWFRSQIWLNLPRVGWLIAIFFTSCSSSYARSPLWLLKKQHSYEVRQVQRLTPTTPLPFLELRNLSILVGYYHSWDFCTPFGFRVAVTRRIERAMAPPPRFSCFKSYCCSYNSFSLSLSLSLRSSVPRPVNWKLFSVSRPTSLLSSWSPVLSFVPGVQTQTHSKHFQRCSVCDPASN